MISLLTVEFYKKNEINSIFIPKFWQYCPLNIPNFFRRPWGYIQTTVHQNYMVVWTYPLRGARKQRHLDPRNKSHVL